MEKDCSACICLRCNNGECMVSMCKGAAVEPEFYKAAIEDCYTETCEHFEEGMKYLRKRRMGE